MEFNASDWYWAVSGDRGFVFSSFERTYVPVDDKRYQDWLVRGGTTTPSPSHAALMDVLDKQSPASLPDDEQAARRVAAIEKLAADIETEGSDLALVVAAVLEATAVKVPVEQRVTTADVAAKVRQKVAAASRVALVVLVALLPAWAQAQTYTWNAPRLRVSLMGTRSSGESVVFIDGSGLTLKGTLAKADLPSAIAYEDEANTFASAQVFSSSATFDGLTTFASSAQSKAPNAYASQLTGWQVTNAGAADFRYVFSDELHAKQFIADLVSVTAGIDQTVKSSAMVGATFTCPAASGTATLTVRDRPSMADTAVFQANDHVIARNFSMASGSLSISECAGVVTSYADQADGLQTWTFTRGAGGCAGGMSTSTTVAVDSLVMDYGVSGNGYVESNAVDGAYGANSPYTQIVTWATCPVAANRTIRGRFGNLNGSYGYGASTFGMSVGDPSGTHIAIDPTNGIRIRHDTTTVFDANSSGDLSLAGDLTVTGTGTFGAGGVTLSDDGIEIADASSVSDTANLVRWGSSPNALAGWFNSRMNIIAFGGLEMGAQSGFSGTHATALLRGNNGESGTGGGYVDLIVDADDGVMFDWTRGGTFDDPMYVRPDTGSDGDVTLGRHDARWANINLELPNNTSPAYVVVNRGGGGDDANTALGYVAGVTGTIVVKGSDGNNCNLVFTVGLLTSETCP